MSSLPEYFEFTVRIAAEAGAVALSHFRSGVTVETKGDGTPVTAADRAAERLLRERIDERFPDHAVLGEEEGGDAADAPVRWILDPIDGTESFARGVPLFAVLVAVEVEGSLDVGVAHFPALGETVAAARGLGCRRNGEPARVSKVSRLADALVSTTSPGDFARKEHGPGWARLLGAAGKSRGWGDAYGHCLVATGRIDAMAEPGVALWDFAPLVPILEEAGGRITDFRGEPLAHGSSILSTNGRIHGECLRAFAGR